MVIDIEYQVFLRISFITKNKFLMNLYVYYFTQLEETCVNCCLNGIVAGMCDVSLVVQCLCGWSCKGWWMGRKLGRGLNAGRGVESESADSGALNSVWKLTWKWRVV